MTFAQKLEDFKLENKLDDKNLFWKENFITLKDENLVKLELHDNDIAKSMYNMYYAMSGKIY